MPWHATTPDLNTGCQVAPDMQLQNTKDRSLLLEMLERLKGKRIVIVMNDERSFKGTVDEFDESWLFLQDVAEGSTINARGWEETTINTGFVDKRLTERGMLANEEDGTGKLVRLKNVLINLDGVLRVWEWEAPNMARPKHVKKDARKVVF